MWPSFVRAHRLTAASPHAGDLVRTCAGRFRATRTNDVPFPAPFPERKKISRKRQEEPKVRSGLSAIERGRWPSDHPARPGRFRGNAGRDGVERPYRNAGHVCPGPSTTAAGQDQAPNGNIHPIET
jgi:hypothetical protein